MTRKICPACRLRSVPPSTTSPRIYCKVCAEARRAAQKESTRKRKAYRIHLSDEARETLEAMAAERGETMSGVVEDLILKGLHRE